MKTAGIIAEYNPFHNGHLSQINCLKSEYGFEGIVIVMSGDFVQRGEPAILPKELRAKMAIQTGADLVFELPTLYATASAEFFAKGGISLLTKLGIADTLAFGMETPDGSALENLAAKLTCLEKSPDYHERLLLHMKQGKSYPLSRMLLLEENGAASEELSLLQSPNNALATEYAKALLALKSPLALLPLKREGSGYEKEELEGFSPSAKAVRKILKEKTQDEANDILKPFVPEFVLKSLWREPFRFAEDFSQALFYRLLCEEEKGFEEYLDISADLSDKIRKSLRKCRKNECFHFQSFVNSLKTRDLTKTRIARGLLHIFLGIRKDPYLEIAKEAEIPYARILAFNPESALLHRLRKSPLPRFTNPYQYARKPQPEASKALLDLDLQAENLYSLSKR